MLLALQKHKIDFGLSLLDEEMSKRQRREKFNSN